MFSFSLIAQSEDLENNIKTTAVDVVKDFHATFNNYCDISYTSDERKLFKNAIPNDLVSSNTIIVNDRIKGGAADIKSTEAAPLTSERKERNSTTLCLCIRRMSQAMCISMRFCTYL